MHELKEKVKPLTEMKEQLIKCLEAEMAKGVEMVSTDEAGKVVDMIKDLADAEKNCIKACYYETVIESMKELEEDPRWGESRSGYNNRRYSNGEYAPAGRGRVRGFDDPMRPYYLDENLEMRQYWDPDRPGYTRNQTGSRITAGNGSSGSNRGGQSSSRYGYSYDSFEDSKRQYDSSHSSSDKEQMEAHAKEYLSDAIYSMRQIWSAADPTLKKKMKGDLTSLLGEMTV